MEEWRRVPGYPRYAVSDEGRVWSWVTKRYLRACRTSGGYLVVVLTGQRQIRVHRLVLAAFAGAPPADRPDTNHIDGEPTNNRLGNLEYLSHRDNVLHAYRTLRRNVRKGRAGLSRDDALRAEGLTRLGVRQTDIADALGCHQSHVSRMVRYVRSGADAANYYGV